jgi:uncharacterized protein YndB with AHSA1/START domain
MTDSERRVELEIEVPGTPEQVWDAIATGPGISAWLHPTTVEEHEGGTFTFDMGGGPASGTVAGWDPPHRFVQESEWTPVSAPPARLATEWLVEAREGGTCVVRMVMTGFGDSTGWDEEIDGMAGGMRSALEHLRLYLTWFPGQRGTWIRVHGPAAGDAWARIVKGLGIADPQVGERVETTGPSFAGVVERAAPSRWGHDLLVRTDRPAPGFVNVFALGSWAGIEAVFFGDEGAVAADRERPGWAAWVAGHLPADGSA